jgi:hypothetical protein
VSTDDFFRARLDQAIDLRPHSSFGRIPPARVAELHRQHAGGAATAAC